MLVQRNLDLDKAGEIMILQELQMAAILNMKEAEQALGTIEVDFSLP